MKASRQLISCCALPSCYVEPRWWESSSSFMVKAPAVCLLPIARRSPTWLQSMAQPWVSFQLTKKLVSICSPREEPQNKLNSFGVTTLHKECLAFLSTESVITARLSLLILLRSSPVLLVQNGPRIEFFFRTLRISLQTFCESRFQMVAMERAKKKFGPAITLRLEWIRGGRWPAVVNSEQKACRCPQSIVLVRKILACGLRRRW